MAITAFRGRWRGLSNFAPSVVALEGEEYPTVEHAFQAAKTPLRAQRAAILTAESPTEAKRLGRAVLLRADWESVKIAVMLDLLEQKFSTDPHRALLLSTGDQALVEGNTWGDHFWGQCPVGTGENWLGRLLMTVRSNLQQEQEAREVDGVR